MLRLFAFATFASLASADLFISEVAEGSSNNKYFEIFNPTSGTVSLDGYAFPTVSNAPTTAGEHEFWNTFTAGAEIAAGDVYVVCHGVAYDTILAECDQTFNFLSNGDDGLCLAQGTEESYTLLDCVGDFNGDPGAGWSVAGVAAATKDHTLVRKSSVHTGNGGAWAASAGTTADDSEWIVLEINDWTNLGYHNGNSGDGVSGCMLTGADNYNGLASADDGSCAISVCTDSNYLEYDATLATTVQGECASLPCSRGEISYTQVNSCAELVVEGCTLDTATNYEPGANMDDGSCEVDGCLDENYIEYDAALADDCAGGTCTTGGVTYTVTDSCATPAVLGCTLATATNYNSAANRNNGECRFDASNNLFISEVAEGSSNNKYIEIFNPTSGPVSLDNYAFPTVSNAPTTAGEHEFWNTFTAGAEIAAGDVYVVCHGVAYDTILAECDQTFNFLSNGDDGLCLAQGTEESYTLLDCVGDFNGDPGSGWDVAGVAAATKDHTLVRKSSVTQGNVDWAMSAGTTVDESEWIVLEINDWTNLGTYDYTLGCTNSDADNYDAAATIDNGACIVPFSCVENGEDCTIGLPDNGKPDIHAVYKSWNGPFGTDDPTFTTDFYTGNGICCYNNAGELGDGYNREHIWPQARWPSGKSGVHSLFNLMPTDASENTARSNKLFGGSGGYTPYNGQTKGIVARVILNLAYRFADCSQADDACFDNMMNYLTDDDADTYKMGDYNVLAQWASDNQQDSQEELHYSSMGGENTVSSTVADNENTFADSTVLENFRTYIGGGQDTNEQRQRNCAAGDSKYCQALLATCTC